MPVRAFVILLPLLYCSAISFSQEVEVFNTTTSSYNKIGGTYTDADKKETGPQDFYWQLIDSTIDTTNFKFISSIRIRERKMLYSPYEALSVMEEKIKAAATKMGANAFKLNEFSYTGNSKYYTLVLNTYFGTDSMLRLNRSKKQANTLFIFPDRVSIKKPVVFKLNGKKEKLNKHEYYQYALNTAGEVKLERGLDSKTIKAYTSNQPVYIELADWAPYPTDSNQVTIVHESLGELLIKVFFNTPVTN